MPSWGIPLPQYPSGWESIELAHTGYWVLKLLIDHLTAGDKCSQAVGANPHTPFLPGRCTLPTPRPPSSPHHTSSHTTPSALHWAVRTWVHPLTQSTLRIGDGGGRLPIVGLNVLQG
eukprot:CAMPEP_0175807754 /NCGR_PEP_ID=MMETSP0107_2-20121207/1890_1 /TAXON_ID=195067 ORGANISM="Goniomonas pacifica, Strain CCMP1869" /NCGR_SAMPLE_ID=MMETSP0107_2 /ASSEMBLY_ACC=CAM_ASM_000203 /LENGTH=116 /DNA_ID=CAMNT_0017119327 /DNA_START=215 /DNA_END=565 /DNA_ORIENTATION=+